MDDARPASFVLQYQSTRYKYHMTIIIVYPPPPHTHILQLLFGLAMPLLLIFPTSQPLQTQQALKLALTLIAIHSLKVRIPSPKDDVIYLSYSIITFLPPPPPPSS